MFTAVAAFVLHFIKDADGILKTDYHRSPQDRTVMCCMIFFFARVSDNRDKAPGQRECDYSIDNINKCIRDIEQASLAAVGQTLPCRDDISMEVSSSIAARLHLVQERGLNGICRLSAVTYDTILCPPPTRQALQEQLTSSVQEIGHLIDPVSTAARGEAAQLGHKVPGWPYIFSAPLDLQRQFCLQRSHADSLFQVTQLASYFDPLVVASVGLASKLHDHQQQMTILDQSKTLSESALQMLYAAKEGGGNPKVKTV